METIKQYLRRFAPVLIVAVLLIIIILIGTGIYRYINQDKTKPAVITIEQAKDPNQLARAINVSPKDATTIIREVERTVPVTTYYTPARTVQEAATATKNAIARNDPALPKSVTEKTDRTVVVENTDAQKVDVYKINLRNNHKIKAGVTYVDGTTYVSFGYQAGRIEAIAHVDQKGIQGGTVMYTIKEW